MSGAMLPPAPGLLSPAELAQLAPAPAYRAPQTMMMAGRLTLGDVMPGLVDDRELPQELEPYEAGLQPFIAPAGTPWQQEIVFDRLARTDRELQQQMLDYFHQAQSYDAALSGERVTASEYYNGRPLGDEETGRSQLVLTVTRDTIRSTLPSLLRVFTAVENPVEFVPTVSDNEQLGLAHAELARQATSYCRWALFTANDGWLVLHDAILDALTRKAGWVRWFWGEQRSVRIEECDRLLLPQLQMLLASPGITAQRIVRRPMLPNEIRAIAATPEGAAYMQAGGQPLFYSARLTRAAARAWPQVQYVPTESVWIVADAGSVAGARAVFQVRDVPVGELIKQGLPEDEILEAASSTIGSRRQREVVARDPISGRNISSASTSSDPSMRMVRYVEGWCMMDTDGDNVAELIHTHAVGTSPKLIRWDRTDEIPLACMTPYREPGRVIGFSQADMTNDLQRTQTRVFRSVLDSLGQSIFPRTAMVVGQANIEDVRQTAIGSIIRMAQPGMVQELTKPFVGAQALPVLEALEALRESRTGITRTSQGLTAESLQSTTPSAVSAQTGAAADRLDMIARTMAETGLVPLYEGLLRMMAKHQDKPNVLSIRGKWVTIDPRAASTIWACQVNIGGKGSPGERLAMLNAIAQKQETILAPAVSQGILETPIVGLPEYRNTLARMCEVAGISDVTSYFRELPPGWQPPTPPRKPSTDELLAQVEQQKTQASIADDTRQAETDRLKLMLDDERSRDEAALQAWVSVYTVAAREGTPLPSLNQFRAAVESNLARDIGNQMAPPAGGSAGGVAAPAAMAGGMPPADATNMAAAMSAGRSPGLAAGMPPTRGPLASLPVAAPPNALGPGARAPIDPAAVMAMRRAMLQPSGAGNIAQALLRNRALMPGSNG